MRRRSEIEPRRRMEAALSVEGLRVSYGPVKALTGVTFSLCPGRVCGVVGMNGSGKSTLIKAVVGTVRSTGDVSVYGESARSARKDGLVGYVPQNEGVDWDFPLSVADVVMMGRYGRMGWTRRPRPDDVEAVDRALDMVGVPELRDRQIGALSGGQRKRVFIARAIAQGARLLLMDEPFAGVDKPSEGAIVSLVRNLAAGGAAVLVATHDLDGMSELCDEALLLLREVVFQGDVEDALRPENLGRAFGVTGVRARERGAAQADGAARPDASVDAPHGKEKDDA